MSRFYIVKWPLEHGIIVAEGTCTPKRATIEKDCRYLANGLTTFTSADFDIGLDRAKEYALSRLMGQIQYHERRIAQYKAMIERVRSVTVQTPMWSDCSENEVENA
jgi:hypothetical protein